MTTGVAFATERLSALVSRGTKKVNGQIVMHEVGDWGRVRAMAGASTSM